MISVTQIGIFLHKQQQQQQQQFTHDKKKFPSVSSQRVWLVSEEYHIVRQEIRFRDAW